MASGLPAGLSAALNGTDDEVLVTGTPTSSGTFSNVSFTITDAWGATDNTRYTITINPAPSLGSLSSSSWTVNQAGYSGSIPIMGGTGPFMSLVQSGLPPGLVASLSGASISITGTPTSTGSYSNTSLTVTDHAGATASRTYTITINPAPSLGSLSSSSWTVNQGRVFGGPSRLWAEPAHSCRLCRAGLPPGPGRRLTEWRQHISITGTPTSTGSYSNTSLTVTDHAGATASRTYPITINPPTLSPTGSSLPRGAACELYSETFSAGAGYSYAIAPGYPPGLSWNNGTLSGRPSAAGYYAVRITATGAGLPTVTKAYALVIGLCADGGATSVPGALHGHAYSFTLTGTGGTGPYRFQPDGGELPPNLSLSPSGLISGIPTTPGTYTFDVEVLDSADPVNTGLQAMTIAVS